MLHLENFFEKSFALLLTTPKDCLYQLFLLTNHWKFDITIT